MAVKKTTTLSTNVTLYCGDVNVKELLQETPYVIVDKFDISMFRSQTFNGIYPIKVVDASIIRNTEDLRTIIEKTLHPTIIIFSDGKIPFKKAEFKTKNKIEIITTTEKADKETLYNILNKILYERDRTALYELLQKNKASQHVLYCFLADNWQLLSPCNRDVLMFADMTAVHRDADRFCELLSFSFKPEKSKIFLRWQRPKKEKETEIE